MSNLNDILSFMYRMDKEYSKAVNLNEGGFAHTLLFEDKRQNQARNHTKYIIGQLFEDDGITSQEIDEKLRELENKFYHDPKMRSSAVMRLEPLICRIAIEECGFGTGYEYSDEIQRLADIVDFLYDNRQEINLEKAIPTECLYNWTLEDLEKQFGQTMAFKQDAEYDEINNTEYTPNNYKIVGPLSYEEANEIGNKSNPNGQLCYTQSIYTWNTYTNNGMNTVYVALADGWENVEAVHQESFQSPYSTTPISDKSAYDAYGLSMIFVFVGPKFELAYCNTRWNHDADYGDKQVDHALNRKEISEIIGMNFFQVFKPVANNFNDSFEKAYESFINNPRTSPIRVIPTKDEIDSNIKLIAFNRKLNFLVDGKLKYKKWFDNVCSSVGVGLRVEIDDKWNLVDFNANLIWKKPLFKWFHSCSIDQNMIFVSVRANTMMGFKYNVLKLDGELLSKKWFDSILFLANRVIVILDKRLYEIQENKFEMIDINTYLQYNFPAGENTRYIHMNGKTNYVYENGLLMSDFWFDKCTDFENGVARVEIRGLSNYLFSNGEFLLHEPIKNWLSEINPRSEQNVLEVWSNNGLCNLLYPDSKKLIYNVHVNKWFDDVFLYNTCDYFKVSRYGLYNVLKRDGNLVSEDYWFDNVSIARRKNGKYLILVTNEDFQKNIITLDSKYIFNNYVDNIRTLKNDCFLVTNKKKFNIINMDYQLFINTENTDEWFDKLETNDFGIIFVIYKRAMYKVDLQNYKLIPLTNNGNVK